MKKTAADKKNKKDEFSCLELKNQLCFPLYACSKEIVRRYRPLLEPFDLTYTQYIVMMVLWQEHEINVKSLGEQLYLDSGTLTPLLKKLESKGYLRRERSEVDERNLIVHVTDAGMELRNEICKVPAQLSGCVSLSLEEGQELYRLLYKILDGFKE